MGTTGRHHRSSSSGVWLPAIMSALLGMTLGAGIAAIAWSAPGPPVPTVVTQATAPSSTPAPPSTVVRPVQSIGFAEPTTVPAGLSFTVLPPEKVKGGVRLTIALVNTTSDAITVDTGELGPHDLRFNGDTVPMTMTPTKKKLMPDEGYTYQCMIRLPTMDMGQLALDLGPVTVTGQAAGD